MRSGEPASTNESLHTVDGEAPCFRTSRPVETTPSGELGETEQEVQKKPQTLLELL